MAELSFEKNTLNFKSQHQLRDIREEKIRLSTNLICTEDPIHGQLLINRLTQKAIKCSDDLLSLLSCFKTKPILLSSLSEKYEINTLSSLVSRLQELGILIRSKTNEELDWIENNKRATRAKQIKTGHFILQHSCPDTDMLNNFSEFIEDVYGYISQRYPGPLPEKRIVIYICTDRKEFQHFWGTSKLPAWAKVFVFSSNLMIVDQEKIFQIDLKNDASIQGFAHELMHVFIGRKICGLPIWLEEGLCEYFSKSDMTDDFVDVCRQKKPYGLKDLELFAEQSLLDLDPSPLIRNICYRQAYNFVSYLMGLKGEKEFVNCLFSIKLGEDFRTKFQNAYGKSIDIAEQAWLKKYPGIEQAKLKISKNLRLIKIEDAVLLYNAFYGDSLKSTPDILLLIDHFRAGISLSELSILYDLKDLQPVISRLFNKRLLVFDDTEEKNHAYLNHDSRLVQTGGLISNLRLNIANDCNMACSYCYVSPLKPRLMDWEIAEKSLRHFISLQKENGRKNSQIRFFGGEPLLNWPVIEKTFHFVEINKGDVEVDYILNTNGTLITEDIARKLAGNSVSVSISLDGVETANDKYRTFKSGSGTFQKIDRAIDILISADCKIFIATTIGNHNCYELKDLIAYISKKQQNFSADISLSLQSICMDSDKGLDSIPDSKKAGIIMDALRYAKECDVDIESGMIMFPFNALMGIKLCGVYCNVPAGQEICIYPDGGIYPCGALKTRLGHIDDFEGTFLSPAYTALLKRVTGNIDACRGCDIEAFCAGGCTADANNNKTGILSPTKNCRFEQLFFKERVKEYLKESSN